MIRIDRRTVLASISLLAIAAGAHVQKKYDVGATDTEIKIGSIMPCSGPASAYGTPSNTAIRKYLNQKRATRPGRSSPNSATR